MDSSQNIEVGQHWKKLRTILKSKNRLNLLNKFKSIETDVFIKYFDQKEGCLIYTGVNPKLESYLYKSSANSSQISNLNYYLKIKKPLDTFSEQDLQKFSKESVDNTGNLQLWPCEEILTFFCLSNLSQFEGKKIIELGAGYSGLCALFIAKNIEKIGEILITDGNSQSVEAIKLNLKLNKLDDSKINADLLKWTRNSFCINKDYHKIFDFILISDCLFFEKFHDDLVFTIEYLLINNGKCIIVCPERGTTMFDFLTKASKIFEIRKSEDELFFYQSLKN
jgi:predicted nicotinamide N-methyase